MIVDLKVISAPSDTHRTLYQASKENTGDT
jgi:hypothetical protein